MKLSSRTVINVFAGLAIAGISYGIYLALHDPTITRAEFERINTGMTKAEVDAIAGMTGVEDEALTIGEMRATKVFWGNEDGSCAATFVSDRLLTKSEDRLR